MSPSIHKLNKLLKAQIEKSAAYSKANPDATGVAEDFDDFLKEILRSDTVAGTVFGQVKQITPTGLMSSHMDMMKLAASGDVAGKMGGVVASHIDIFGTTLAMAYWAMQVGREVERAESKLLASLDNPAEQKLAAAEAKLAKVEKLVADFEAHGYGLQAAELKDALTGGEGTTENAL